LIGAAIAEVGLPFFLDWTTGQISHTA
jgi:hypothetical protein